MRKLASRVEVLSSSLGEGISVGAEGSGAGLGSRWLRESSDLGIATAAMSTLSGHHTGCSHGNMEPGTQGDTGDQLRALPLTSLVSSPAVLPMN